LLGKLAGDEFKVDQREIGSRLVGPPQREDVFVWHDARYGRTGLRPR
jgi:hypothetical protein